MGVNDKTIYYFYEIQPDGQYVKVGPKDNVYAGLKYELRKVEWDDCTDQELKDSYDDIESEDSW